MAEKKKYTCQVKHGRKLLRERSADTRAEINRWISDSIIHSRNLPLGYKILVNGQPWDWKAVD